MGFKEDADFARYLTMGVHAARAVADDLTEHGHRIIELERYAMANKVWPIKVKRLRLPDLLCIRCGRRFESKGKSKLELKLSHSAKPGREWYGGGMREDDVFAFIRVELGDVSAETGRPIYVTRSALHDAEESLQAGGRKASSAGSEADVKWPAWTPSYSGTIFSIRPIGMVGVGRDGAIEISVWKEDGRVGRYTTRWSTAHVYVRPGDHFDAGDIVAGSVAPADVRCMGDTWQWMDDLASADQDDRYAAVKAARFLGDGTVESTLRVLAEDDEDWRIRLEAAGALAVAKPDEWIDFLAEWAADVTAPDQEQMEAIFLLSELDQPSAAQALIEIARPDIGRKPEIRSAAVWGLGLGANSRPDLVAQFLDDDADLVALHAAAALPPDLPGDVVDHLIAWLTRGEQRQSAIAAHVLARHGHIDELISVACDEQATGNLFAIRALGDLPPNSVQLGRDIPSQLRSLLLPIWAQHDDWLRRPENEDALPALESQRLRY